MRFVLTACYPTAGWNPQTAGMNHGEAQTLLRYAPESRIRISKDIQPDDRESTTGPESGRQAYP